MSIQAVAWVLEHSEAEKSARLVLLALANHADSDGTKAFPSVATIAREARLSERGVQYALRALEADGSLEITGATSKGTTIYRVVMGAKSAPRSGCGVQSSSSSSTKIAPEPSLVNRPEGVSAPARRAEGRAVTFNGRPVNAESWALTEKALAEFNRQAGTKLRLLTSAGEPSAAAKRVYGRVRAYPDITFGEHASIIERTLRSRWWGNSKPTIGVVYGPNVFEDNITRDPAPITKRAKDDKVAAALAEARAAAEEIMRGEDENDEA